MLKCFYNNQSTCKKWPTINCATATH